MVSKTSLHLFRKKASQKSHGVYKTEETNVCLNVCIDSFVYDYILIRSGISRAHDI